MGCPASDFSSLPGQQYPPRNLRRSTHSDNMCTSRLLGGRPYAVPSEGVLLLTREARRRAPCGGRWRTTGLVFVFFSETYSVFDFFEFCLGGSLYIQTVNMVWGTLCIMKKRGGGQ